jgi:ribosomal protein S12 methylthiotransferase accessory factor
MNDLAQLTSFTRRVAAARPVGVLATPATLALLPAPGERAQLAAFAGEFAAFPAFQRKWRWSAMLQAQLAALLARLAAQEPEPGCVYLYLQGAFSKRYFPGVRAALPSAAAAQGCRAGTADLDGALRAFGNASVQGLVLQASPAGEHYHCYQPATGLLGIGRGGTDLQRMRGAVLEYCERWAASIVPAAACRARYVDLGASALRPDEVAAVPPAQTAILFPGFAPRRPMHWLPCQLVHAGTRRLVPLQMINYLVRPDEVFSHCQNSNGCALGSSATEAALFGALELIERDALLLAWYSRSTPPRFIAASIDSAPLRQLHGLLELAGYTVCCFDITTEFALPAVLVLLLGQGDERLGTFVTAACHPDPHEAMAAALGEAHSLAGITERNLARQRQRHGDGHLAHLRDSAQAQYYGQHGQRHHFDFLAEATPALAWHDFVARHAASAATALHGPAAAWDLLCARSAQAGYELIVADVTPAGLPALGLYAARVFLPGTLPLTFGDKPLCLPRDRLARAARHCPWVDAHADLSRPLLHPLG